MKAGDRVLLYHSGGEKAVVGTAKVAKAAYPDPAQSDPKLVVVDLIPEAKLAAPVPLSAIRADPAFAELALLRNSRLSVMPVTGEQWKWIVAMGSRT